MEEIIFFHHSHFAKEHKRNKAEIAERTLLPILQYSGFTIDEIRAKTRKRPVCKWRQICAYFLDGLGIFTLKEIGDFLNPEGFNHATIIYSVHTVRNLIETDTEFELLMIRLKTKMLGI